MFSFENSLPIFVISCIICVTALLLIIRERKNPRWLDVAVAIILLLISAIFLGIFQSVLNTLTDENAKNNDLIAKYQVAVLIIPFFSANLATSLIANALLSDRDYSGQISLSEVAKSFLCILLKIVICLIPITWAFFVYYKWKVEPNEIGHKTDPSGD